MSSVTLLPTTTVAEPRAGLSVTSVTVCVSACALRNGLSYQRQSWNWCSQWQFVACAKKWRQKLKRYEEGHGHMLLVKFGAGARVGLHIDR